MKVSRLGLFGWLAASAISANAFAQSDTKYETVDGVTYQVTNQTVQRSIPQTEIQTQQQKIYHPQVTTQYQTYAQTYMTPVTEYQWVPTYRGWWNPLDKPYWSYDMRPVTRWQATQGTVQVPTTRTDLVEENRTVQIPVTTYKTVAEQHTSRVPVSAAPAALGPPTQTSVAINPYGGTQLQGDPPKGPTSYR